MTAPGQARAAMERVFGFSEFLPRQEKIINAVLAGENVLAVLPTGGGKSLCYQLPALLRPGLTVVVSPLIALMRDQVAALRAAGVAAGALHSGNIGGESQAVERDIEARRLKLLYVAPERFAQPNLIDLLKRGGANFLAVDEAHCICQWGHDFRPEYLALREIVWDLGGAQTIAVTATANAKTRAEIGDLLFGDSKPREFVGSFDRPNLRLAFARRTDAFRQIGDFAGARRGECGIIYCASRDRAEKYARALSARGHRALAYHAGLDPVTRAARQDEFIQSKGVIMCATIAFGMGIDKPDVRFVCHVDPPSSIESYYQEIGRAGRDGAPADTLALWSGDDFSLRRRRLLESDSPRPRVIAGERQLGAMLALCEAPRCRRQVLLAAFGEHAAPCGNCDRCAGVFGPRYFGALRQPRFLAPARAMAAQAGKLLTGEASQSLRKRAREWPAALAARLAARARTQTTADAPEPLAGEAVEPFRTTPADQPLTIDGKRLLASLSAQRLAIARKERQPPVRIIPDAGLAALAARRPRDTADLAGIEGFTAPSRARHGPAFLRVIREHEGERGVFRPA